jgi:predicted RNA-binding protein associated with RNAse of E/G family
VHPVRVHTLDLAANSILLDGTRFRTLERAELTPHGLHYANDVPDHPQLQHVETHLIPGLDLMVSQFVPHPGMELPERLYLDMASIEVGPETWTMHDPYLDVAFRPHGVPRLLDADEYAEAVLEGHLTPDEQRRALLSAERVVNGLFAHGNSLQDWLASLSIRLDWWRPLDTAALHSSS